MKDDEKRMAAARLLTKLAEDDSIGVISDTVRDMDPREVRDLLSFAARLLHPAGTEHHRELFIHVDGASIGNPGPAGAGVVIMDQNNRKTATISQPLGTATNNVAEYRALIMGLTRAKELGASRVHILADSELMVKQITGDYRVKDVKLRALSREALELIDSFDYFDIVHVDREKNGEADRLAKRAAEAGGER